MDNIYTPLAKYFLLENTWCYSTPPFILVIIMEEELKSLKNPTRILSILMFLAIIITSIGVESLSQALPFIPEATITVIVGICAWAVNQYGTEARIVRAEDIKEQEIISDIGNSTEDTIEVDTDGV